MNNSRRKRINQSVVALTSAKLRMLKALEDEKSALARIPDDDKNEEMRDGMEEIISELEDSLSSLDDALETLKNAAF